MRRSRLRVARDVFVASEIAREKQRSAAPDDVHAGCPENMSGRTEPHLHTRHGLELRAEAARPEQAQYLPAVLLCVQRQRRMVF